MSSIAHARGSGTTDRVMRSAARGAGLIGLAVVLGIVLLQVVDEGSGGGGGQTTGTSPAGNVTTTTNKSGVRNPEQVRVVVLNGSGTSGAAATTANVLRGLGYVIASAPGNAPIQTGTVVECQTGFDAEGATLAATVGKGATVGTYPATPPVGAENTDCIVIIGK
jgi:hypothetical protein